jgi:competence protein ComEC
LQSQGVKRLDYLILTHPHEDHIGSADSVIRTFEIGRVIMPQKNATTQTFTDVVNAIKAKSLGVTAPKVGMTLDLGSEVDAQVLAPGGSSYEDVNNYSVVVRLVYGNTSFLFTGDAQAESESQMISSGLNLKADVLKVGHHGSNSSTTPGFLSKVSPECAVISVGTGNSYGHPTQATLDKLSNAGVKVYRTDQNGTIVAESDGTNITFNSIKQTIQSNPPPTTAVTQPPSPTPPPVVANPTPSGNSSITVYTTNSGSKYHRDGCQYLSKSKVSISLADAKSRGLEPCSKCNPPQ